MIVMGRISGDRSGFCLDCASDTDIVCGVLCLG